MRRAMLVLALGVLAAVAAPALVTRGRAWAHERAVRARADSLSAVVVAAEGEGRAFRGQVGGRPVALLVEECRVYDLTRPAPDGGRGRPVLEPELYPWPTTCTRQRLRVDGEWVTVTLGRTAFGAGGCCATGGTYRSRDGRGWEKRP